jgi:hypothetical protein
MKEERCQIWIVRRDLRWHLMVVKFGLVQKIQVYHKTNCGQLGNWSYPWHWDDARPIIEEVKPTPTNCPRWDDALENEQPSHKMTRLEKTWHWKLWKAIFLGLCSYSPGRRCVCNKNDDHPRWVSDLPGQVEVIALLDLKTIDII